MDWYPLYNSIRIAAISTVVIFFLGIFAAYYVAKTPRVVKGLLDVLLTLPLVLPPTVVGYLLLRVLGPKRVIGAWVLVKVSDVKYLTWNMTGALALCAALLFVRNEAAIYAAVGVLGFAMACVFATFYAVATKAVPENANEVAGLMIMAISAGAVSGPVCGAIVRAWGNPHLGMLFVAACVAYMLWASIQLKMKN